MYIAELRGKFSPSEERKEDILTSDVFSFFKYADRQVFLAQFLKLLGLGVSRQDLAEVEFLFWHSFEDGTEPDLVIITGKYYLLVEAKFHSDFGQESEKIQHQLVREYKGGELEAHNMDKEFQLVAVTAHYARHQFLAENSAYVSRDLHWLNWHQIALLIASCLETHPGLTQETRVFAEDLYDLLVKKNLRKYAGVDFLKNLRKVGSSSPQLFFEAATAFYRGDFLGFTVSLQDSPRVQPLTGSIFYKNLSLEKRASFFDFTNYDPLGNPPEAIFYQETNHE